MQSIRCRNLRIAVLAALFAASTGCAAQPSVTPPPAPVAGSPQPPPRPAPPPSGAEPDRLAEPASIATAQGTVARFLTNPDGDVDGFLTDDGTLVRLPPHMGVQVATSLRRGDLVEMNGMREEAGAFAAQRITDTRTGRQIIDEPPPRGPSPLPRTLRGAGLSRLSAQGQVARVTTAPHGEPDGVILSDGTVIKLTPPVAQQFATLVRTGATVSAQGYGTRNEYGTALQATAFGSPGNLTPLYDRNAPLP
uniref:Putative secreted protein n=1 Tax=Burkholderia sp. (strain CCGE1003) TaxID=640512 RepID=E1TJP2_BURSG